MLLPTLISIFLRFNRPGMGPCTRRSEMWWLSTNTQTECTKTHHRNTSSPTWCPTGRWGFKNTTSPILVRHEIRLAVLFKNYKYSLLLLMQLCGIHGLKKPGKFKTLVTTSTPTWSASRLDTFQLQWFFCLALLSRHLKSSKSCETLQTNLERKKNQQVQFFNSFPPIKFSSLLNLTSHK